MLARWNQLPVSHDLADISRPADDRLVNPGVVIGSPQVHDLFRLQPPENSEVRLLLEIAHQQMQVRRILVARARGASRWNTRKQLSQIGDCLFGGFTPLRKEPVELFMDKGR